MIHKIVSFIFILFFLFCSGCIQNQPENQESTVPAEIDPAITGTWLFTHGVIEQTYRFCENGSFYFNDILMGSFETQNGEITLIYPDVQPTITMEYHFQDAFTLDLTDEFGATMKYMKQ